MANKEILKLLIGFRKFRERFFEKDNHLFDKLTTGQSPKTLIIACSDSRVDPALMVGASPGDLFVVRNVANLVPPYETSKSGRHGVSAAIEFAISQLKVENVVILGHRQCGGIRALVTGADSNSDSFIERWMSIAKPARDRVFKLLGEPKSDSELDLACRSCEMESIAISIDNLKTFPFVLDAIENRHVNILGIYFDLEQGQLFEYDEVLKKFNIIQI